MVDNGYNLCDSEGVGNIIPLKRTPQDNAPVNPHCGEKATKSRGGMVACEAAGWHRRVARGAVPSDRDFVLGTHRTEYNHLENANHTVICFGGGNVAGWVFETHNTNTVICSFWHAGL